MSSGRCTTRRGLLDGLFVNDEGKARTTAWVLTLVSDILRPTADQAALFAPETAILALRF